MKKHEMYVTILVILTIPFLYAVFFLKAFWDPYNNIKDLPIAIVNMDNGNRAYDIISSIEDKNIMKISILKDDNEAIKGVKNRKYYASITIPEDFSENIENIPNADRIVNTLIFRTNKKYNFLSSQIYDRVVLELQKNIENNINSNIIYTLTDNIQSSIINLKILENGLEQLNEGSLSLSEGISSLDSKYLEFNNALTRLDSANIDLNKGLVEYTNSTNQAIIALEEISNGVIILGDKLQILKLSDDFKKLYNGAKKVKEGNLKQKFNNAGNKIISGSNKIVSGNNKLVIASSQISDGIQKLDDGSFTLNNGINTAHNGLSASIDKSIDKVNNLKGIDIFSKENISINIIDDHNVPNYGLAFAPYFISLSLWVGGLVLIISLYYDRYSRFKIFDIDYPKKRLQYLYYLGLISISSLLMTGLLYISFGFNVNILAFFLAILLIALAFFSIIFLLIIYLEDIGKLLSVLILIIQLSASGGTFPIETTPMLFRTIYNYMPMKYSINLLKEILIDIESAFLIKNISVLLSIFIVASILILIYPYNKKAK